MEAMRDGAVDCTSQIVTHYESRWQWARLMLEGSAAIELEDVTPSLVVGRKTF
jgi:hypothetical protein